MVTSNAALRRLIILWLVIRIPATLALIGVLALRL
jgi:hypothetical protein